MKKIISHFNVAFISLNNQWMCKHMTNSSQSGVTRLTNSAHRQHRKLIKCQHKAYAQNIKRKAKTEINRWM